MLKLDGVKFQHGGTGTEYDFSLAANPGEVIGIMGASGSGKSTLLDLVAGFQVPEGGTIRWQNADIASLPPEKRPMTILFQNHNLFDHLSAARNVAIGLNAAKRVSGPENKLIYDALSQVGLEGKETQRASTLSGGQQQRVALARSIVRNKPLLLLDEPFSGLDEDTKLEMLALVKELAATQNRCVLMVTHDRADCAAIATRQYVVESGKLVAAQ